MAVLMPEGRQSFEDSAGRPLVGGKLYTYTAGTSAPAATFVDAAGTTPNTNPIILDARGEATIFWSGSYKATLTDALDAVIWTQDNIISTDVAIQTAGAAFVTQLRSDLADTSDQAKGDAMIGVQSTLAGSIATTQHEVNERVRSVFDWLTAAERTAVKAGTVLDVTVNVQEAIDSGASLYFPEGTYYVKTLIFSKIGKSYWGNNAQFIATDTAPQRGVIDYRGSSCRFYGFSVVGLWKSNYAAAVWWHSASAGLPAQSTVWFGLAFDNVLMGFLFGDLEIGDPILAVTGLSYQAPVDAAQSENFVYGLVTRGIERPVYFNQPNGFLKIEGKVYSSKSEWDINSPGIYDFTRSCPVTVKQGALGIHGDVGKTDTQLGSGFKVNGGGLSVSGNMEIASQVFTLTAGVTHVHDIDGSFWGNAATDWCNVSGNNGVFVADNVTINKSAGAAAAATALINFSGASGWDVTLDKVRAENQLYWVCTTSVAVGANRWSGNTVTFINGTAPLAGGAVTPNQFPRVTTGTYNLLDLRGTDVNGNDIATWFKRDTAGVGAIALDVDVPAGLGYPNSIQVTPAVTTGGSEVTNMDLTSLATVKNTAIKCRPGDTFMLSGWFRMTTAGTAQVDVTYANAAGGASASAALATQADVLTNAWKYIEAPFVPPAAAAYLGVGIRGTAGTVCRMVGLRVTKLA